MKNLRKIISRNHLFNLAIVFTIIGFNFSTISRFNDLNESAKNINLSKPPQQEIGYIEIPGQPLRILVGSDGRLQVYHQKYFEGATFGEAGSGFFVNMNQVTFGYLYSSYRLINQGKLSGSGQPNDPYSVSTTWQVGENEIGLQITQTISYISSNNYFQLDWQLTNIGKASTCLKAYHAADLYFADDDYGIGYYDARTGSIGGYNESRDWFMVFIPNPRSNHYEEAHYTTIWERVGSGSDLQDLIDPAYIDNGAALEWDACLAPGERLILGDQWSFGESELEAINPGEIIQPENRSQDGTSFRQPGPLTPRITTYIPTPLEISLDPKVIGANILLALLAMLAFTIASEVFNRTLAENEPFIQQLIFPFKIISRYKQRFDLGRILGHPLWYELIKLAIILFLYGFIFSLLDNTWDPFSLTGLYFFASMTIAYGFIGLLDDIVQWAAARLWKIPANLSVAPGNLLTILFSAGASRIFGLLPGMMFGMPEAFNLDTAASDNLKRKNSLLRIAAGVLLITMLFSWLPTFFSSLLLRINLPDLLIILIGGLQSFSLLIFAITVQNFFLQMLTFPETFGRALAQWNKPVWFFGLLLTTFVFLHTLLNPQGDLAKALAGSNLRFFLATIYLFLVFSLLAWLFFKLINLISGKSEPISVSKPASWIMIAVVFLTLFCLCLLGVVAIIVMVRG
jgi:hypothetical protein